MLRQASLWANPPFNGKPPATEDDIGDLVVWATIGVLLGGRIGWIIFYGSILCGVTPNGAMCSGEPPDFTPLPGGFLEHPLRLIAVWDGGMSFHGAAIGVILAIVLFARRHHLALLSIGDLVCSVQPIGQFFGRIANFVNGELWGKHDAMCRGRWFFCTPHIKLTNHGDLSRGLEPRHPSQLYEAALEGLLLLTDPCKLASGVFRWHERPGDCECRISDRLRPVVRFIVEFFREPDAPFLAGPISMGQGIVGRVLAGIGGLFCDVVGL